MNIRRLCAGLAVIVLLALEPALAKSIDFDAATIADINAAFDAGTVTAESLTQMCLARIAAFDRKGPALHAVMTLNPKAVEQARALDVERKTKGRRSPLHGIPVVLKDNYDTFDMPTTGGSVLLEGSIPPKDAFVVKKLRDAGAIILAKLNMSEFASGGTYSSLGGQSLNPHDLARGPVGFVGRHRCRGGGGVRADRDGDRHGRIDSRTGDFERHRRAQAHARAAQPLGDHPARAQLRHRRPMARNVYDVAAALGIMTGIDPADPATSKSDGKFQADYTKDLRADALRGARIGVARDFMGADPDVDWVMEAAFAAMRKAGATLVDVRYPKWLLDVKGEFYTAVRYPEFTAQIAEYLKGTGPKYPKTLAELIDRANEFNATRADGVRPNPSRWTLFKRELESGSTTDYRYTAVHDFGLPMIRAVVEGMLASQQLDAIAYPTASRRPALIAALPPGAGTTTASALAAASLAASDIANLTGFPDLIVPAGFTGDSLPVGLSFLGAAFSEPKLLSLGYSFEQATKARRRPINTPALPGEGIGIP
jgi:amidase